MEKINDVCMDCAAMQYETISGTIEERIKWECEAITSLGLEERFHTISALFQKAKLSPDEYYCRGKLAGSLVAYLLGITAIDPLHYEGISLYPEFCFGLDRKGCPEWEFTVTKAASERLMQYPIRDTQVKFIVYEETPAPSEEKERLHEIESVLHPQTFREQVRCMGLSLGTGTWEDNAKELFVRGIAGVEELISDREDIYEFLLERGLTREGAYEIADYVRAGKAKRLGFRDEQKRLLVAKRIPEWFIDSCCKIDYLFPRAHLAEWVRFQKNCKT